MTSHLVTGGAGFIGSALVKTLVHEGHQVTVLDDFSRGQDARIEGLGATVIHGDVRDLNTVLVAIQGCESVIHMAFKQGTESFYAEPRQVLDVAIRGITNVLLACELTACRDLLLVSSSEAYQSSMQIPTPETVPLSVPDPLNPRYSYAGGKIASELMALAWQRAGVLDRVIIARPHNIIGPDMGREHVVPEFAIRMNRLVADYHPDEILPFRIQGTGLETRSFCWIGDCIDQLMLLLGNAPAGSEIYHVGVMDEKSVSDVAHTVARVYERKIKVIPGTLQPGSPARRLPDNSKITALGWDPDGALGFDDAIYSTVRWYQDHG